MTDKNVEITKTYQTRTGLTVTINGFLALEKTVWLDGDEDTVDCCEMSINVHVSGKGIVSYNGEVEPLTPTQKKQAPAGYNWKCGNLGLTDAEAEIIKSVRTELEAHPAGQEKQAVIAANEAELTKLHNSRRAHPGWCERCQSYTYGDCGHS